jgi:hypothetical protein
VGASAWRKEHADTLNGPPWSVGPLVAIACALLLADVAPGSVALGGSGRLIALSRIDGLRLTSSYEDALKHFGQIGERNARATFMIGECKLQYPQLGLTLWWAGNPLLRGTPQSCVHFQEGAVTAAGWHTRNGLSIGDSTAKLLRLFPHAFDTNRPGPKWSTRGSIQWDITITCCAGGQRPALSVLVKHRRVVAIFVEMVGH